jgi:hypothetical protein
MITADTLKTLTTFTHPALQQALGNKARDFEFTGAKFIGLTNGNEFCYNVVHRVGQGTDSVKVFLTYDPVEGRVIASMN